MNIKATLSLQKSSDKVWDVIVIGAGPAGALAAYELTRRGVSVLLVDRAAFPRRKVCGSCFNQSALAILEDVGLQDLVFEFHAQPVYQFLLAIGKRQVVIPLPSSVVLSRETFDAALIKEAIERGSEFLPQTQAVSEALHSSARGVILRQGDSKVSVKAKVVLAADGLGGNFLQGEKGFETKINPHSRVGVNAIMKEALNFYSSGIIFMACARGGYIGLVRLEDGQLNIAAALDPRFLKKAKGPGKAVVAILRESGLPFDRDWETHPWCGTPELTRHRSQLAAERLFVLGDAAGYVEPFTGEGIAWALASGTKVVPLVLEGIRKWDPLLAVRWNQFHFRQIGRRQNMCWGVTRVLQKATLMHFVARVLSWKPSLAAPFIQRMNAPFR